AARLSLGREGQARSGDAGLAHRIARAFARRGTEGRARLASLAHLAMTARVRARRPEVDGDAACLFASEPVGTVPRVLAALAFGAAARALVPEAREACLAVLVVRARDP